MKYFVMSKVDGLLPLSEFARMLTSRWPGVTLDRVANPASNYSLEFRVPMKHSRVDGSLDRDGSYVAFVGELQDCAEFALWCRSIVPPHEPLTFCDESLSGKVDLTPSTTTTDILHAFRESGG